MHLIKIIDNSESPIVGCSQCSWSGGFLTMEDARKAFDTHEIQKLDVPEWTT